MRHTESPMDRISQSPNFKPFMKKLALAAAVFSVAGLILKLCSVQVGGTFLIMGMGTMAIVAFMLGHLFPCPYSIEDEGYVGGLQTVWKFAMTLTGYSAAIVLIALLFILMHWYGGRQMLFLGGGSLAVSGIAWLYFCHLRKKSNNQ